MWVLIAASILALLVFLERLFHLHRAQIHSDDFLDGLYNVLRRGNVVEAVTLCEDVPGPVAQVVRSAILKADDDPEEITRSVRECGLSEIPRLEHNLSLLATLGRVLPMLGFLGTVLALLSLLGEFSSSAPYTMVNQLMGSLRQALITSAYGFAGSIPIFAGYNFLVSRVETIILDMERAAADIQSFLAQRQKTIAKG